MNSLLLALFLLRGPGRADNPFQLLILDDPLQNMDELTVSAVSRGLRGLLRLWKQQNTLKDWRLLVLLHSEEDFRRLFREIPSFGYGLRWKSKAPEVGLTRRGAGGDGPEGEEKPMGNGVEDIDLKIDACFEVIDKPPG